MAKEYKNNHDLEYQFTEQEIKILEERRMKRLDGVSKTFNRKEAKEIITRKKDIKSV
jgi:hypothetical protein